MAVKHLDRASGCYVQQTIFSFRSTFRRRIELCPHPQWFPCVLWRPSGKRCSFLRQNERSAGSAYLGRITSWNRDERGTNKHIFGGEHEGYQRIAG